MTEAQGPKKLVRVFDWQERLTRYLVESQQEGIRCDWEFNHCGGWVDGAVVEMTGESFMEPFKDVDSPISAIKAIKAAGHDSLEDLVRATFPKKPLIFVKRGDVVLVRAIDGLGGSLAVGIADPPFYWALGESGLGRGAIHEVVEAFSVGDQ
jgi:hypothetical protein